MKYLVSILLVFILFSCDSFRSENPSELVLTYANENLVLDDIECNFPKGITAKDSLSWIEDFKKQWIRNQIIINKVEKELPNSELNIKSELLQYKADLLKFRFENYYIKNKINTQVSLDEIELFYDNNKNSLKVLNVLVKATYVEIPNTVKDRYKVKQWLPSKNEKYQEKLKVYCFQNAVVYDDFEGDWIELNILKRLSDSKELRKSKLEINKVIYSKNESTTRYFLINEIIYKGSVMPLEYAKKEIVHMVINNRKSQIIEELNRRIEQAVEAEYK